MAFSTVGTKRNRCLDFFLSHCPVPKTVHPDLAQSAVSICRGWVKFDSLLRRAFRNLPIFIRSSPQTDVGVSQSDIGWSKTGDQRRSLLGNTLGLFCQLHFRRRFPPCRRNSCPSCTPPGHWDSPASALQLAARSRA